jgi:hypothetical protein
MESLMNEFGASPPASPTSGDDNTFNDGVLLTPAVAVLQDPFEEIGTMTFNTPAIERPNPLENRAGAE